MKSLRNFIGGDFIATNTCFNKRSPVDNSVIAQVHEAGSAEVDAAVKAARAALEGPWGRMPTAQRLDLLFKVADEIDRRFEEFVEAETADTGMPAHFSHHVAIPRGAANFRVFAEVVKNVASECFPMDTPDGAGAINYSVRRSVRGTHRSY